MILATSSSSANDENANNNASSNKRRLTKTQASASAAAVGDMTRRMICGGLAGCIAKTATNPLERIKMLSQVRGLWCCWIGCAGIP